MAAIATKEHWLCIDGTNAMYEVSTRGRVRSWHNNSSDRELYTPQLLRPGIRKGTTEYLLVSLYMDTGQKKSFYVHSLVAEKFLGPRPSPKHEIGHRNGMSLHNDYTNLRWVTKKENAADKAWHSEHPGQPIEPNA